MCVMWKTGFLYPSVTVDSAIGTGYRPHSSGWILEFLSLQCVAIASVSLPAGNLALYALSDSE